MKIERHYYTEDKKRWEQAEAKMNARYDGRTEAELQAEMQFLTQSFGALSAECRAALAHVRQAPSQKKAEQFSVLRNQASALQNISTPILSPRTTTCAASSASRSTASSSTT